MSTVVLVSIILANYVSTIAPDLDVGEANKKARKRDFFFFSFVFFFPFFLKKVA